jgi:hypothetical protein
LTLAFFDLFLGLAIGLQASTGQESSTDPRWCQIEIILNCHYCLFKNRMFAIKDNEIRRGDIA